MRIATTLLVTSKTLGLLNGNVLLNICLAGAGIVRFIAAQHININRFPPSKARGRGRIDFAAPVAFML